MIITRPFPPPASVPPSAPQPPSRWCAREYRKYKATFHASPPSGASQHPASDHPAPLGATPSLARAPAGQPCRQPAGRRMAAGV